MSQLTTPCQKTWPQALLELLERQRGLVGQLAQLADAQGRLIAECQTDQLLDLLAQRQAIIDAFTSSQSEMTELTSDMSARMNSATPAQRQRIQSLIGEIGEKLSQVMQRDEQDQNALRGDRDRVRQELARLGAAKQARHAYQAGPGASHRFADRHG